MVVPDPITEDALQAIVVTALTGPTPHVDPWPTGAQANVFAPRDWPTAKNLFPLILVMSPRSTKEAVGQSGAPSFNVSAVVRVVARVRAAGAVADAGAKTCLTALAVLQRQIEVAIINAYDLMLCIKRIAKVEAVSDTKADGEFHLGELVMDFTLEFYQGATAFAPVDGPLLTDIAIFGDLINCFDATGTYAGSPFPASVLPAPRASGPDGRAEVGVTVSGLDQT